MTRADMNKICRYVHTMCAFGSGLLLIAHLGLDDVVTEKNPKKPKNQKNKNRLFILGGCFLFCF